MGRVFFECRNVALAAPRLMTRHRRLLPLRHETFHFVSACRDQTFSAAVSMGWLLTEGHPRNCGS